MGKYCQEQIRCQNNNIVKNKGFIQGILYGLLPHSLCILFIIFSILGATLASTLVKKALILPYFFPLLIIISLFFAFLSALIFLKRNGQFSLDGLKKSWKYLSILFGTTLMVNILFVYAIFPLINKTYSKGSIAAYSEQGSLASFSIKVDFPCEGHVPLVIGELQKQDGIIGIDYLSSGKFKIIYNKEKINKSKILSIEIFSTYQAREI